MSEWLPVISATKDVIVAMAAITAAGLGVYGVQTWKRQLAGTAEWDLARRWLRRVYAVRESIPQVRGIFMTIGETEDALKKAGADHLEGDKRAAIGMAAAYDIRWKQVQAAMSDLQVEAIEAEVLWGQEAVVALEPLRACIKELQVKLHVYLYYQRDPPINASNRETMEKAERVVFPIPDDSGIDQFGEQLAAAITAAEAFIRPRIAALPVSSRAAP
jgi:hypothetical protein